MAYDEGSRNALENWVNRMSEEEREALFEVVDNYKKFHSGNHSNRSNDIWSDSPSSNR